MMPGTLVTAPYDNAWRVRITTGDAFAYGTGTGGEWNAPWHDFTPWPRVDEEERRARFDYARRAAGLSGGVPPCDLALATCEPAPTIPRERPRRARLESRPRFAPKQRRPIRARRRPRVWERVPSSRREGRRR